MAQDRARLPVISAASYATTIDWRDDRWTPRSVQAHLLGPCEYLEAYRSKGADTLAAERQILREWGRIDGKPGKWGKRWHHHLANYTRELIPQTFVTPSFLDALRVFEDSLTDQREMLNLIGSKNSGKSAVMARIALALVTIEPEFSVCRIAAPFKNAAHATIWGELTDCFKRMKARHPDKFPEAEKIGTRCIIEGRSERHGHIELIGVDQTGKFQGAKAVDPSRGFFLLKADEVALFPSETFIDILGNVTGNENFFGWTGCNFRRIDGMEGKLCLPEGGKYEDLDMDRDWLWRSDYNSVTMRIDGHKSPNVMAKRVIYSFLLTERKRANMEQQHGLTGPKYLEQIRSFPNTSAAEYFVLRRDEIRSSRAFDDGVVMDRDTIRVAAGDPGLGGGDDCTFAAAEFGRGQVVTSSGRYEAVQIFRPLESIRVIPVDAMMVADEEWIERVRRVVKTPVMINLGQKVSPEDQVAVQYAENLMRLGIPSGRFGYDASMRGSVTHAMVSYLGLSAHAIDFGVAASPRKLYTGQAAFDAYTNLRGEMYFNLASLVRSGQMREAERIDKALDEVCGHKWEHRGQKQKLETKKEYKERNNGESPNHADALVILVEVAQRAGMRFGGTKAPGGQSQTGMRSDLRGIPAFMPKRGQKLSRL